MVAVAVFATAIVAVLVVVTEAITGAVTGVNAYVTPGGVNAFRLVAPEYFFASQHARLISHDRHVSGCLLRIEDAAICMESFVILFYLFKLAQPANGLQRE